MNHRFRVPNLQEDQLAYKTDSESTNHGGGSTLTASSPLAATFWVIKLQRFINTVPDALLYPLSYITLMVITV